MKIKVLGSGAGGGFPQWNCNCPNCKGVRTGTIKATPRTQSSIAVSNHEGKDWVLINASPDIRTQLLRYPVFQPDRKIRDTALVGVILVDAQIDHATGLLFLRETKKLDIYCTPAVHEDLTTQFPIFNILKAYCTINYHAIDLFTKLRFQVPGLPTLFFTPIPLEGKAPPYSTHRDNPMVGDNIGLYIQDTHTGKSLFYAPGLAKIESEIINWMHQADCLLVDGTCWDEDELIRHDISSKQAADMGHIPQSGEKGMIAYLTEFKKQRKILIHINNTNPILKKESIEHKTLAQAQIEVAEDGMDIYL
jgi:pyrroloquinoline quinone biosynthesis protein B